MLFPDLRSLMTKRLSLSFECKVCGSYSRRLSLDCKDVNPCRICFNCMSKGIKKCGQCCTCCLEELEENEDRYV